MVLNVLGIRYVEPSLVKPSRSLGSMSSRRDLASGSFLRKPSRGVNRSLDRPSSTPSVAMLMTSGACPAAAWVTSLLTYSVQVVIGVKLLFTVTFGYFSLKRSATPSYTALSPGSPQLETEMVAVMSLAGAV